MPNIRTRDTEKLTADISAYLAQFPGDTICPLQVWYEGLEACGTPAPEELAALTAVMDGLPAWEEIGAVRYEKFGVQPSYFRKETPKDPRMVQHCFKPGGLYREPDGKVLKVVVSEVYNLRCFEMKDGHMTGKMIRIHPQSDRAKALAAVTD